MKFSGCEIRGFDGSVQYSRCSRGIVSLCRKMTADACLLRTALRRVPLSNVLRGQESREAEAIERLHSPHGGSVLRMRRRLLVWSMIDVGRLLAVVVGGRLLSCLICGLVLTHCSVNLQ